MTIPRSDTLTSILWRISTLFEQERRTIHIHGTLGQDSELGVERVAGVLLNSEDGELDCHVEGRVSHVGLLVTQTHRTDEALVFDRPSGEVGSDECRLVKRG